MSPIETQQILSDQNVNKLREKLASHSVIFDGKACIYATGSYGRCEASEFSDLDVFIVGKKGHQSSENGKSSEKKENYPA